MKITYKLAAALLLIGALIAAAFITSGKAAAAWTARVEVSWGGTNCIQIQEILGEMNTRCGGFAVFHNSDVYVGTQTGVDPIMGSADWVACDFYLNGVLKYTDLAFNGDGTDVNCLREITSGVESGMWV